MFEGEGALDEDDVENTVFEGGGAGSSQSVGLGVLLRIFGFEPKSCSVMLVMLNTAFSKPTLGQLILILTAWNPAGNSARGSDGFERRYLY